MYEKFRNDLLVALMDENLDVEDIETVCNCLDAIASRYTVSEAETSLVLYDDSNIKVLKKYIATKRVEGKSENTLKRYSYEITRMLEAVGLPIKEISTYHLRFYLGNKKKSGTSERTLDGTRKVLSSFFRWLTDEGYVSTNPCSTLKAIKYKKEQKKAFSSVELEKIREACENIRDLALVDFMYSTGCRVSEIAQLDISDIDFDTSSVEVLGKGNKVRRVYLSPVAVMHLNKYLNSRNDFSEALFEGKGTERLSDNGIRRILKRLEKTSQVENVHPHRFRRTLATNLLSKGMRIEQVSQILGHEDLKTTQIYCQIDSESVKAEYMRVSA